MEAVQEVLTIPYRRKLGADVAFINKAGVARGTVGMVYAELKEGTLRGLNDLQVKYRLSVKNASSPGTHWEDVDERDTFETLDEAWKAFTSR